MPGTVQEITGRFAAVRSCQDRRTGMVGARVDGQTSIGGPARSSGSAGRQDRWPGARYGRSTRGRWRSPGLGLATSTHHGPRPSSAQTPPCRNSTIPSWRRWHASTLGCGRGRRGRSSKASSRRLSGRASASRRRRRPSRRLCERFNGGVVVDGRQFWPPPLPEQLASSSAAFVRESGVTTKRAEALVAVATLFASEHELGGVRCESSRGHGTAGIHFRNRAMDRAIGTLVGRRGPGRSSHAGRRASAGRACALSGNLGFEGARPSGGAMETVPRLGCATALAGPSRIRPCQRSTSPDCPRTQHIPEDQSASALPKPLTTPCNNWPDSAMTKRRLSR